ncbi:MAG: DUF484 family protein [Colwellia sp.]|uniref:DUF484 family protein n=1 Tax=Colwellia sp. Bg11-12 TaxID=2759817 RepID=UPI0015F6F1F9|nr:DUF484 family protein [Colwellia sp. Bg11-12]MBA6263366.1 DUF484 family protein [Colwellia sp. Bg11-12]
MNDSNPIQLDEVSLTDDLIVDYLHDNPEFFNRNPELINSLRLSDINRGTVSLVQRQQSQQRQKIHGLEEEITQLMAIANQNEQLFALYSDLYLRLLDCSSANELLDCMYQATTELLSLSGLKVWLKENTVIDHTSIVKNDCAGVMNNRLSKDDYYFGRLQKSEQELIFSQHQEGSVVLIKLNHLNDSLGFIAISSADADHFDPRMDTLLLSQFRKLVAKLLFQQLYK